MRQVFEIPKDGTLQFLLNALLGAYNRRTDMLVKPPPIGETSIAQKLDAVIAMQEQFGIRLGLLEARVENVHGLVFDLATSLTTDSEKIKELTASVKAVREKLQTSVDSQTKGE